MRIDGAMVWRVLVIAPKRSTLEMTKLNSSVKPFDTITRTRHAIDAANT